MKQLGLSTAFVVATLCSFLNAGTASAAIIGHNIEYEITADLDNSDGANRVGDIFHGMVFVDDTDPNLLWDPFMATYDAIGADWDSSTTDTVLGGHKLIAGKVDGIIRDGTEPNNSWQLTHYAGPSTFDLRFGGGGDVVYSGTQTVTRKGVIPEPTTLAIWSLLATLGISSGWRRRRK